MIEFDPDGDGPLQRDFYMGGWFSFADAPEMSGIARWDGFAWRDVGVGLVPAISNASGVWTMCVGPDVARTDGRQALYVGGSFASIGGVPAKFVAKWDGERWSAMGDLTGAVVFALQFHDFDGPGPQPARLAAAGSIGTNLVLYWDGSAWQPVGAYPGRPVQSMTAFDPDGDGPSPSMLFVCTNQGTSSKIAWFDGSVWRDSSAPDYPRIFAVDPDGAGPEPQRLYAAGSGSYVDGAYEGGGVWQRNFTSNSWEFIGLGNSQVNLLCAMDLDGPGPAPTRLVAGRSGGIWSLIDGQWQQFTTASGPPPFYAAQSFDDDGAGPREPSLFFGGALTGIDGMPATAIARYGCPFNMPRCYGDADGSGMVEFNDVSLVLARWGSRDQPGDIDHDGVVGMNDVVAVLASWSSDCEALAARPSTVDAESAWRARGIEDFNGDGAVNMDDEFWAIANAGLDARSPYGRMDQEQPLEAAVGRTPH
jgi:hypothetical protein